MIKIINRIEDFLVKVLIIVGVIALAGIVIIVLTNVFMRYFLKQPLLWSLELCGVLVLWLTFCLFGVCYAKKQHFCITAFDHLMSKKVAKIVDWFTRLVVFVTLIALLSSCLNSIKMNGKMTLSSMPKVNMYMSAYLPMLIGIFTYFLFIVFDVIRLIAGKGDWEEETK